MSWAEVPLGEIFEIARGGSPRPIVDFITDDPNGLNWVMIGDATASGKIIYETKKRIKPEGLKKSRAVVPGDFLLSNSMSFGRPYIMGTEGCIHDGWLLLRPRNKNVDQDYFYHLLGSPEIYARFASRAGGATVKNLNSEIVREVEIPLPPLEDQKRIAAILDQADALRRLRRRALDRLNTLGQAIFHEMFGDPVLNPMGWPKQAIGDLCSRISVGVVVRPASYYQESGVPALRGTNIKPDGIDISDLVYFSTKDNDGALKKSRIWQGDVIAVRSGRPGLSAVVPAEFHGANSIDILISTPNPKQLSSFYLRDFLNSAGGRKLVLSESRGQVQQHFNVKSLSEGEILLPPLDIQYLYVDRLMKLGESVERARAAFDAQEDLFASLQHRAFRGEL
jgi:type I restriction enzyme S subunit